MTVGELIEQLKKFNPEDKIQIKYNDHYMGADYDTYKWADKIFHRNALGQSTIVIEVEEDCKGKYKTGHKTLELRKKSKGAQKRFLY